MSLAVGCSATQGYGSVNGTPKERLSLCQLGQPSLEALFSCVISILHFPFTVKSQCALLRLRHKQWRLRVAHSLTRRLCDIGIDLEG